MGFSPVWAHEGNQGYPLEMPKPAVAGVDRTAPSDHHRRWRRFMSVVVSERDGRAARKLGRFPARRGGFGAAVIDLR